MSGDNVSSKTFKIIITSVAHFNLDLHHMDVKTMFLNSAAIKLLCQETQRIWFADLRNLSLGSNKHIDNGILNLIK